MADGGAGNLINPSVTSFTGESLEPIVSTNKADYAPGETATITGSGFMPNSEVVIQIADSAEDRSLINHRQQRKFRDEFMAV